MVADISITLQHSYLVVCRWKDLGDMRIFLLLPFFLFMKFQLFAQPITAFYYKGSPVSFVTRGKTATATPENGYSFSTGIGAHWGGSSPDYVYLTASNTAIDDHWEMFFGMPKGLPLAPGTYINATRYPIQNSESPGLDFSGNHAGNNQLSGKFTILEIAINNGQLVSFAADFTQYDEMALASWTYGSVRLNSSIPLNTLPPEPQKSLSVACTNSNGPLVIGIFYTYSSTCIAGGGVGPYTWSFANLPPGLQIPTGDPIISDSVDIQGNPTSPGPFNYTVTVTDSENGTALQNFNGITSDNRCVPIGINYQTYPRSYSFGPSGGRESLSFGFSSEGCQWTLSTDIPGIIFSPSSGQTHGSSSRNDSATFTVAPNTGSTPLMGNIFLSEAGEVVFSYPIVVNSNSCNYTVNPASGQFGPQGGSGTFEVTSDPNGCYPFFVGSTSWLSLDSGVYYYEIPPNAGTAKSGGFPFAQTRLGETVASFRWEQEAGDGSLLMNCYKPGPSTIGSTLAICVAAGGTPPYTWNVVDGALPGDYKEVASDSISVRLGKPRESGPYQFTVRVTDSAASAFATARYTITGTVPPRPPEFNCSNEKGPVEASTTYATVCVPESGTPPYQWSVNEGGLPTGLVLTSLADGVAVISGVPSSAGDYYYSLQLTDSTDPVPMIAGETFHGTINASSSEAPPFAVSCTDSVVGATAGFPIETIGCSVSGGVPPYTWSLHDGILPKGLSLSSTTGEAITIAGTPTESSYNGYFNSHLKVTDSSSAPQSRLWTLTSSVYSEYDFNCSPAPGQTGQYYFASCTGLPTETWISDGQLPPGLELSSKGISGIPTSAGRYAFTVSAQNGKYPSLSHSYEIVIGGVTAAITITTNPGGRTFSVDGTTHINSQTFSWTSGSNHTISTNNIHGSGETRYVFTGWSDGGAISHTITVPAEATTYTASFDTQYLMTTTVSPLGAGSISVSPMTPDGYYASGSTVQISAVPSSGYVFSGWSGDAAGTANPQNIAVSAPRSITANFRRVSIFPSRTPPRPSRPAPLRRDRKYPRD